jgi:hypothetical protein
MYSGSYLELERSVVSLGRTSTNGTIVATNSSLHWTQELGFSAGSSLYCSNGSDVLVNGNAYFDAGSRAFFESSNLSVNGAYLVFRKSSMWIYSNSAVRLYNGSISIGGCADVPLSALASVDPSRPCSLFLSDGAKLQTDNMGDLVVAENGLLAATNGASVSMSSNVACAASGIMFAGDSGKFSFSKDMYMFPGCILSATNASEVSVLGGTALALDSLVYFQGSNCTYYSPLHRTIHPRLIHSYFPPVTLQNGSVVLAGDVQVAISDKSHMFIGNYTYLSGGDSACLGYNCSIGVDGSSTLTSVGSFGVVNGARVIGSNNSDISVLFGDLFVGNNSILSVNSGSRLMVNGSAIVAHTSAITSQQSSVFVTGSLVCNGPQNGLFVEEKSQLIVGGSISLESGSVVALSESVLTANLGNITTDANSAIYLRNNSLLAGIGRLDATVYAENSSTSRKSLPPNRLRVTCYLFTAIGGPELTDIFIKTLNLSSSSSTVATISSSGSTLKINSTTAVINGQLTVTIQTGSLAGLKAGGGIVLISSDNITGNFSDVNFIVPSGENQQCYKVQQNTKSLAIVFSAGQSGCDGSGSAASSPSAIVDISSNDATIIGAAVGGSVGFLAILFIVIVLAVPSVRVKIFPFMQRDTTRHDTLNE